MQQLIFQLGFVLVPLILSITVHEFSHVAMARFLGDDLGTRLGRFTLDPLKHIDPMWTVALPMLLIVMSSFSGGGGLPFFAAGKPAPYNPLALRRKFFGKRITLRNAELLVAAAGPMSNLLLAFLSMIGILVLHRLGYNDFSRYSPISIVGSFVYLNVSLFVFNLIPVPPLDGSKVLVAFLPHNSAIKYEAISSQLSWALFAIVLIGGGAVIGGMTRLVVGWLEWIVF